MSVVMEEEIKRWTARRKSALILEIIQGKTTSIRSLFYLLKHTIEGTNEETFDTQDECDPIIEDAEVTLDAMREELHLFAKNAGAMVGPITLTALSVRVSKL